jgi:hypothetical protein
MWETDETDPFYFNDCSSGPTEGISQRHSTSYKPSTNVTFGGPDWNSYVNAVFAGDLKGGATIGLFGGAADFIRYRKYYQMAYRTNVSATEAARLWCGPPQSPFYIGSRFGQ